MNDQSYFDKKLIGGAVSQRGINFQILICIKYIFDFFDDIDFMGVSIEQHDDFEIITKNQTVSCQVKSTCYDIKDIKRYLDECSNDTKKKILICSAFSNEVHNLIEKKIWFEYRIKNTWLHDEEKILLDYKEEVEKKGISFDVFSKVKLDTIPCDYAETIAISSITLWAQKNNIAISTYKLMYALYHEISVLGALRNTLTRDRICEIVNECVENKDGVNTSLCVMENIDILNEHNIPQDRWLYYVEENRNGNLSIVPKLQYWDEIVLENKPMHPVDFYWEPFKWDFPNLDIKVLNNSNSTLYLTKVIFEIKSSIFNPSPILFIKSTNVRHIALYNDGWGTIKKLKIKINCEPTYNENFEEFGAEEYIGDFTESKNIDISGMLGRLTGIDFDYFDVACKKLSKKKNHFFDEYDKMRAKLFKEYLGEYANGLAYINGLIDFESDTAIESDKHYVLKFSCWTFLYEISWVGAPAPPSYQYDIELPVEGENYIVEKSISQVLKSGDADRFNLKVHCEKSSNHFLNVYLKSIDEKKYK